MTEKKSAERDVISANEVRRESFRQVGLTFIMRHSLNKFMVSVAVFFVLSGGLFVRAGRSAMITGINMTKHNLSVSGPGPIKSGTETRICIFCHTPHNALPSTPLWNKRADPQTYKLYYSSTMVAQVSQPTPTGPSRLCLSCHDGTIALGDVLTPLRGNDMSGVKITSPSSLITNLDADHPISFSYYDAVNDPQIRPDPPPTLTLYGQNSIECSTCHDPHDDRYGKFLVMDNRYSALCVGCHDMQGWLTSDHRNSTAAVSTPLSGLEWTNWQNVAEYGCEGCHTMHNAGGPARLMRDKKEEDNCYQCHDGSVAQKNIKAEFLKTGSHHPVELTTGVHQPNEPPELITDTHVECVDCHNPHASNANASSQPNAGAVSGMTQNVSGMNRYGSGVTSATYQYEICFKCHSGSNFAQPSVVRELSNSNNMRLAFDVGNPSYHPIEAQGKAVDVPSLINPTSTTPPLSLTTASIIYCTDCHDSDDSPAIGGTGARGPHGSQYPHILRERYNTSIVPYNPSQYALCYRCHRESSIMSDVSFQKNLTSGRGGHSEHVSGNGISCSVCHDPHGVNTGTPTSLDTGDHTHLINFDLGYVAGLTDSTAPIFKDGTAPHSGSCTLVCHMPGGVNVTHDNVSYGPGS